MIDKLGAFIKIAELGSFTHAGEQLGYTQSAMSQSMKTLEAELGVKLFNRTRRDVRLTPEGEALLPYAKKVVQEYISLQNKVSEVLSLERATVRIGALASISTHWLPDMIRKFKNRYPSVEFSIHQGDYTDMRDWIEQGRVDFAFIHPKAASSHIEVLPFRRGNFCAIVPEDHPLAQKDRIPLEVLANEDYILLEEGHYYEPLEAFRSQGIAPQIRYVISDDYAIMGMVEAGLGVSLVAELALRRCRYRIAIRPTEPTVQRVIGIGYRKNTTLPLASQRFIDLLLEQAPDMS